MNKPYPKQSRFSAAGVATALILIVSLAMGASTLIDQTHQGSFDPAAIAQSGPNHG
jgi:hypothetical protein